MLLVSCQTTVSTDKAIHQSYRKPTQDLNYILNEISGHTNGVYSGISGIYSNSDKMMGVALMDAAKNVLIHEKVVLKTQTYGESKNKSSFILFDDHIKYKDDELISVLNKLEVQKIIFSDSLGCVVIVKYKNSSDHFPKIDFNNKNEEYPKWISDDYSIDGYVVGIGITNHYSTIWDSIEAADYLSVYSIFSQVNDIDGYAIHNQMMINDEYKDKTYQGNINSISGVKIIDRYYDKEEDKYYSLALLKK